MNRLLYLHGFASSPQSRKAQFFGEHFAALGVPFEAPDLAAGDFEHLTISSQLRVIEKAARGEPVTLMGSSLGAYLAAVYASRHPEVDRLVLMAPAFCFGSRWGAMIGAEKLAQWRSTGSMPVYHYGEDRERNLDIGIMADAEGYDEFPSFRQPALIFHGISDTVVPKELSQKFAAMHPNVTLFLLDSGHELTNVLEPMWIGTREFLQPIG